MSNEYYIALLDGNVLKSRSVTRAVPSGRWDKTALLAVKGIPGKLTVADDEHAEVDVEAIQNPHLHLDEGHRLAKDGGISIEHEDTVDKLGSDEGLQITGRRCRITKKDLDKYGYTYNCPRCIDLEAGHHRTNRCLNDECRLRMYLIF